MNIKKLLFFTFMSFFTTTLYANSINNKIDALSKRIDKIDNELILIKDEVSIFDLTAGTSIDKINTNVGPLYIQISDVTPEKDGYRIKMHLGNPLVATFNNVTLQVAWHNSDGWKREDFKIDSDLILSTWTPVEIHLSPISSTDALKAVLMSLQIGNLEFLDLGGDF